MTILVRLAERVLNTPLLVTPEKAEIILDVISGRIGIGDANLEALSDEGEGQPGASRFRGTHSRDGRQSALTRLENGVAAITIDGTLVNRGAWVGAKSGLVSYEGIGAQIEDALADPEVSSILLDINSPGGEAGGMLALAAQVREANKVKPVVALVNDMAASAAYGIASGAREIVVSPTSVVGSIGVVLMHLDRSVQAHEAGVRPTLIHAGAHKVDGNPFQPLSNDVRARLQAEVDDIYGMFLDAVAEGRGRRLTRKAARETEAGIFRGQKAVDRGLADRVGTYSEVISSLAKVARPSKSRGATMDNPQPAPAAANPPPAPAATVDPAAIAAQATARIEAILSCEEAKGREDLARHLALKTQMPADDAKAMLAVAPKGAAEPQKPAAEQYAADKANAGALGLGAPQPPEKGADGNYGWSKHIGAVNKRFEQH